MIGKGELLITIMSSLAQEESRSISENVTWGHRKRFADGKVCVPYRHFLGYDKGPDGKDGYTFRSIARELTARGLETPAKKKRWYPGTVESILTNEKYKGDALLKERLTDTEALEKERDRLSTDLNLLADKVQQLIAENARVAQNHDDYDRNYSELVSRYEAAKKQYDKTCDAIQYRKARSRQMDSFIKELQEQELIKEFDARLWGSLVDFITVYSKDDIRVTFKDGTEIKI